ncbi:hypothetical protein GLOTRDRAFT_41678 [Gloeophyllum trabeum ATCC 11539]|uniref:Uncharacterized protein n=1 Tax=Gloeophyllum trabeum (strain ATCC 11539 / FP-39264 / Madison 617) TaxID=670483 RepID=S7Q5E1_GLOTA|nr:uncharacterized protein GLOTRDRAFT_41678 [Gloeophyllum trabeum ATCC 11539]EPQ55261.1 hypothetical protein GLOTRDRAFT_41678 [Gloeophyllum trabeum ATCC 11539]
MPKRVSTPPPDWKSEPKYFTIYQPYPIHANMELDTDRKLLCFWIACILGDPKYLFALFHKPSSPNMVIIEVDRSCPSYERLLGEHKWSEFLLQPHCDEVARSSKIYYSRWSHARGVEKNGECFIASEPC